jgi:hypothetical protein
MESMPGILAGLLSKLAGLGTLAKAGIATATAAVTMTVAGGAAGVLPLPGAHVDTVAAVQSPAPPTGLAANTSGAVTTTGGAEHSIVVAPATQPAASASTHATTGAGTPGAGASATAAAPVAVPDAATAALGAVPDLPALPACIKDLIPAKGTTPDPAKLIPQLVACIRSLLTAHLPTGTIQGMLGSANLPANVSQCLSALFASAPTLAGGTATGFSQALAACVPTGSLPGAGSIPGFGSVLGGKGGATTTTVKR